MDKSKISVKFREYISLRGEKQVLVQQVGDGSIIKRFDKTPMPMNPQDVICPHFLELKWGMDAPISVHGVIFKEH
jgi:hypothetical protein